MYIYNIKINRNKILIFLGIVAFTFVIVLNVFSQDKFVLTNSSIETFDYNVNDDNYVKTLEKIHNSIDENIGKKIKIHGFYYTLPDLDKNFFICSRYIADGNETKIAGFICMYEGQMSFEENEWIEITGTIIKGEYNGEIPVINVDTVTKIPAPANMYVS